MIFIYIFEHFEGENGGRVGRKYSHFDPYCNIL
jgi:hypothetical protein